MSLLEKVASFHSRAARKILRFVASVGIDARAEVPPGVRVRFALVYHDLIIGFLSYDDGRWHFKYTDEFRSVGELQPLIMFPDVDKVHESEELWPFFQMRIPSLKQPAVRAVIAKEQIDPKNLVQLLRRFGRRTISNPFELREMSPGQSSSRAADGPRRESPRELQSSGRR